MESTDIPNNLPEDTEASAMESACTIPADIKESNDEHQREAICKRCGAVWHPKKSDTRRPTRCPYCLSRKTEWVDVHPELLELRDKRKQPDADETKIETEAKVWNARETTEDIALKSAALNEGDTLSDTEDIDDEEIYSDDVLPQDDTKVSSCSLPASTAVSAEVSAGHSKQKGFPIAALYLIIGVMVLYTIFYIWGRLKRPAPSKASHSKPTSAQTETRHMGLAEMAMKQHHLL